MKFYLTLFIAFTIILITPSSKIKSFSKKEFAQKTKMHEFAVGVRQEVGPGGKYQECFNSRVEWMTNEKSKKLEVFFNKYIISQQKTLELILSDLKKPINRVCLNKKLISELVNIYNAENPPKRQTNNSPIPQPVVPGTPVAPAQGLPVKPINALKRNIPGWDVEKAIPKLSNSIDKTSESIKQGKVTPYPTLKNLSVAMASLNGKPVKIIAQKIRNGFISPVKTLIPNFVLIRNHLKQFLKSQFMKSINEFLKCIQEKAAKSNPRHSKTVELYLEKMPSFLREGGYIKLVIGLICAWEDLRISIGNILEGISTKDKLHRWNLYGKAIGKIIYNISFLIN